MADKLPTLADFAEKMQKPNNLNGQVFEPMPYQRSTIKAVEEGRLKVTFLWARKIQLTLL